MDMKGIAAVVLSNERTIAQLSDPRILTLGVRTTCVSGWVKESSREEPAALPPPSAVSLWLTVRTALIIIVLRLSLRMEA
jgi:hypothetical protein